MKVAKLKIQDSYWMSFASLALVVLVVAVLFLSPHFARSSGNPLTGYAWSETIGWVDLSCRNSNAGCDPTLETAGNWGLNYDGASNVTGYAWSENIGWISANAADTSGCGGGGATYSGGNFSGWLKALGASGGWDGCISLRGASPAYGVNTTSNPTYDPSISGAWGSTVVGWLAFNVQNACVPSFQCVSNQSQNSCTGALTDCGVVGCDGTTGQCRIGPSVNGCISLSSDVRAPYSCTTASDGQSAKKTLLVKQGNNVVVYWNTQGVTTCSVTGGGLNGSGTTGSGTVSNVQNKTQIDITCSGGGNFHDSAVINIVPVFQEK